MRLLTKQEVKESKRIEQDKSAVRGLRIAKYTNKAIRNLNIMKDRQEKEMHAIRKRSKEELDSLFEKRDDLLRDIDQLENRRKELMQPVDDLIKQASLTNEEADDRILNIENDERLLAKKKELLVTEKQEVDYLRKELQNKISNSNSDEEKYLKKKNILSAEEIKFKKRKNQFKIYQDEQTEKLEKREQQLKNEKKVIFATEEWCKGERVRLQNEQKHINSQNAALKAAFKEAKSKKII